MNKHRLPSFCLAALGLCATAQAQTSAEEWEFELSPYLWAMGMKGTVSVGAKEAAVDASFSDLVKSLDFAAMAELEARKGPWTFSTNLLYSDLGKTATLTGPRGGAAEAASVDLEMLIAEGTAGRRLGEGPLEALLGARVFSVNATVDGPRKTLASGEVAWVDPFVGLRLRKWYGKWQIALQGDIGGTSELSWGVKAGLGYRVSRGFSLHAFYDALDFDHEGGREIGKINTTLGGFGLAGTIHF